MQHQFGRRHNFSGKRTRRPSAGNEADTGNLRIAQTGGRYPMPPPKCVDLPAHAWITPRVAERDHEDVSHGLGRFGWEA